MNDLMKIKCIQNVELDFEKISPFLFLLIILTGFLIRYSFIRHESLWPDEALYMLIGKNLSVNPLKIIDENGKIFFQNPPFFMYLLSIVFRLSGGGTIKIAHMVTVLLDTGTIILIGLIGTNLYNKKVGLLSAALLALNPLHVWTSTRVLTDVPLVFLIYLSLFFLIRKKYVLFYLFSFLSVATKYPALPIFVLPFINKKTILKSPRFWFIIYLLVISVIVCMINFRFDIQNNWVSYFTGFFGFPDFKEIYKESIFFIDPVVCILFFIGIGIALKQKDFSPILMWIIIFGTARLFLPWLAFRVSRYTLPLYPAILMFSAYGGVQSFSFFKNKLPNKSLSISVIFAAILIYIFTGYSLKGYAVTNINSQTFLGYKQAGKFLLAHADNPTILTPSPRQIKYYAPAFTVYDLNRNFTAADMARFVKDKKINFVSIDKWSPHQPDWYKHYSWDAHGYRLVYNHKNILIFELKR